MGKKRLFFILIFVVAVFFRFQNINWDSDFHLHPDERFLTMVGIAMSMPESIGDYFSPATSPLNPTNIGYPFFVYGIFPLVLNKIIAVFLNNDTYNLFTLQGRIFSATMDLIALIFIIKSVRLLKINNKKIKINPLVSGLFYAATVLSIQLSHFFTTDTFMNTYLFVSFYFLLRFYYWSRQSDVLLSAVFFGLALASKISAIYIIPLFLFLLIRNLIRKKRYGTTAVSICLFGIVIYGILRMANPYYFQTGDLFAFELNSSFVKSLSDLRIMSSGDMLFPPAVQWYSKIPILFSLFNLVFFGLGPLQALFLFTGMAMVTGDMFQKKKDMGLEIYAIFIWVVGYFFYSSIQFSKTLRYLIFLLPFFSIFSAIGFESIYNVFNKQCKKKHARTVLRVVLLIALLVWPLSFTTIYFQKHTRVQASEWIYNELPDRSIILSEYWDDALPLSVSTGKNKQFIVMALSVFDPDTDEKWKKLNSQLMNADYYILSSNRGWGSMSTVPEKYPRMSRFYNDMFDGRTKYKLIKQFIPTYQFFFPFHPSSWLNHWFDESFTVYDHPSVFIYENTQKKKGR